MKNTEIAKEIRTLIKTKFNSYKVSVTSTLDEITVSLMESDINVNDSYEQLNIFFYNEWDYPQQLKSFFNEVDKVIKKYYWNNSDSQVDYYDQSFFFNYNVGKWNKPHTLNN